MTDPTFLLHARRNQEGASWEVFQLSSVLALIKFLAERPGADSESLQETLSALGYQEKGTGGAFPRLLSRMGLIEQMGDAWALTSTAPPGMCSGERLAEIWREEDWEPTARRARYRLASNFFIFAPESMQVLEGITPLRTPRAKFKQRYLNHLVFNQNLNSFKVDNLPKILDSLGVVESMDGSLRVVAAPPAASIYWRVKGYLECTGYELDRPCTVDEVNIEIEKVLPREEPAMEDNPIALGLSSGVPYPFRFERANRYYRLKLDPPTFIELLSRRLLSPLAVANILRKRRANGDREALADLRRHMDEQIIGRFDSRPVNYDEILEAYEW